MKVKSDDPRTWPVSRDRRNARHLTLPNGTVQKYDEDTLADMCVQAVKDVSAGRHVDEAYLVTLRHLAGEEEWRTVVTAVANEDEIIALLTGGVRLDG